MGLFSALVGVAVDAVSESRRSAKAAEQEAQMSPEDRAKVDAAIARAEAGDIHAMVALGNAYAFGNIVGYNPEEAAKWLTKAAHLGDVESMYNLGVLYSGSDVTHVLYNENLAGTWFNEAARRGEPGAIKAMKHYKYNGRTNMWQRVH